MPFSKLFALLAFSGIGLILVGAVINAAFYVFVVYNAVLLILLIIDFIVTPGKKALEIARVCEEKLSMGTDNEICIKIRNNSDYYLDIECRDDVPPYFKNKGVTVKVKAVPHEDVIGNYTVEPQKRGEFTFGNIYLRYSGILKLCSKKGVFQTKSSYKVYPNLKDLSRYSLAAIKKSQLMHGMKKVRNFGIGTEFESLREYGEGDDYRKINWMATARASKFIVNTYEAEKNQQIFIMLDSSRVMNSEINYIKKLDYAINSSFLLAEIAIKKGDNIGVLVFDDSVKRYIKPGKGMSQFQLIAENLYNVEENFVTADYKGALMYLNENHKRRSLLCIFTELFNTDEALELVAALKSIARNHVPLIITIKDMRLYDLVESDIKDTKDVFMKSASMKLIKEREKIRKIFAESGIACIDVPPDKLSVEVINKYINMKSTIRI